MTCAIEGCHELAHSHVTWGPVPEQQGNLCELHIAELWEKVNPLMQAGLGSVVWIQDERKEMGT